MPRRTEKADLLYKIADEADKGVLVTADWMTSAAYVRKPVKQSPSRQTTRPTIILRQSSELNGVHTGSIALNMKTEQFF